MVLWLDAARGLRELYPAPAHRIVLLANVDVAALIRSQPYFDCVLELDRERFSRSLPYRWRMLRRLRAERFSLALNPAAWQDYYVADSILGACMAVEKVGWSLAPNARAPGQRLMSVWRARRYTRLVPIPSDSPRMLRLNAEFLRAMGHKDFVARPPRLHLDEKEQVRADSAPYYVLCPGAASPLRRWSVEHFAAVAQAIFAATGMRGAICGSIAEKPLAVAICGLTNAPLSDLTGATTLEEFARFAAGSLLVISNDSGALHIAAAAGSPTLCVVGGGTFGWCVPYDAEDQEGALLPHAVWHPMECFGCNWRCIFRIARGAAAPCVVNVTAEEVAAAALAILASPGPRDPEHRSYSFIKTARSN